VDGIPCILSFARDISEAKSAQDEIMKLAFYDSLTGLPNRRLLWDRLRQSLTVSARSNSKGAVLFIDLDDFKTLNDTLGHKTGDLLLHETSKRLLACMRDCDTVARLGGDEFVVIIEGLSELADDAAASAKAVAEKISSALAQPYLLAGHQCFSTASIGIRVFAGKQDHIDEVMQQADIAMYKSKAAGRKAIHFFAPALQTAVNARVLLEEDIRRAIGTDEFQLHYQPQMDRGLLIGVEALLRWKHPNRGYLPPESFLPMAEETGLIVRLGDWILETAFMQAASWGKRKETNRLSVAVNVSAHQFHQPEFVDRVLNLLTRTGANPRNITLELTESVLVDNLDEVIDKMSILKFRGFRFSLDDFGTGYSSLSYLRQLPLHQIKIDRSFVRDMLADGGSRVIAHAIISLSLALGLSVIAEGVETEEQRDSLSRMGCHSLQGYLISSALPLDEFELWRAGIAKHAA
jgi:diguanylate cyclase (GGDEF)-like protein